MTVSRTAKTFNGAGGFSNTTSTVGTYACRVSRLNVSEQAAFGTMYSNAAWKIYCSTDADIQRGDSVSVGGKSLTVLGVQEPSLAGSHYEVLCEERQSGR